MKLITVMTYHNRFPAKQVAIVVTTFSCCQGNHNLLIITLLKQICSQRGVK